MAGPSLAELEGVAQDAEDAEDAALAAAASETAAAASEVAAAASEAAALAAQVAAEAAQDAAEDAVASISSSSLWSAKITIPYTAFAAAALTSTIDLGVTVPILGVVEAFCVKHSAAFTGGAVSAVTLDIGITGVEDKYASAIDVFQAIGDDVFTAGQVADVPNFAGTTALRIRATSVGANLDQLSQGSVDVWIKTATLPS